MLPRQSSVLWGDRKWGCCEDLIAPPGFLLTPYPSNNRKHIDYLFIWKNPFFSVFHAGQQRLKGMFQVLSGSTLQLLDLRARGVSWWKTKTLGYADLQNVLFAPFPGKRIFTKSEQRARHEVVADRMAMLGFREDRGHLTSLGCSALPTTASVY